MKADEFYKATGSRNNAKIRPILEKSGWTFRLTKNFVSEFARYCGLNDCELARKMDEQAFQETAEEFLYIPFGHSYIEFPVVAVKNIEGVALVQGWDPSECDFCAAVEGWSPSEYSVNSDIAVRLSRAVWDMFADETFFLNAEVVKQLEYVNEEALIRAVVEGSLFKWLTPLVGASALLHMTGQSGSFISELILDNFVLKTPEWNEYPQLYRWNAETKDFDLNASVEQHRYSSVRRDFASDILSLPRSVAYALMEHISENKKDLLRVLSLGLHSEKESL